MERHEYEQMVEEMRVKWIPASMYVRDLCELMPDSVKRHLEGFADTMSWEFKLPDNEKERPYLTWSLGQDRSRPLVQGQLDYLVTVCYGRGEFGFYPCQAYSPIRIFRRTPRGWSMQEEMLVDELISIAKYTPECDIRLLLWHITDTFLLKVPHGLLMLTREKVNSSLGEEAWFLFLKALNWRHIARACEREKKTSEEGIRIALDQLRAIERDLKATKSFTKSKILRAIRERCRQVQIILGHALPLEWDE